MGQVASSEDCDSDSSLSTPQNSVHVRHVLRHATNMSQYDDDSLDVLYPSSTDPFATWRAPPGVTPRPPGTLTHNHNPPSSTQQPTCTPPRRRRSDFVVQKRRKRAASAADDSPFVSKLLELAEEADAADRNMQACFGPYTASH
eukprot:m.181145 g.181145  ORF g.181145 m.181145 type:complete len:144 (+) comp15174_c0_seq1:372-803(+)